MTYGFTKFPNTWRISLAKVRADVHIESRCTCSIEGGGVNMSRSARWRCAN